MAKVIYPITWLAGREGDVADVIHDIAVEMMEHRADLHRHSEKNSDGEYQDYQKQARLFEEYATVLDAIYYQLEPERWDPETSGDMLNLAQMYNIVLPDWMLPDQMKLGKAAVDGPMEEIIENELYRFENEGGRNVRPIAFLYPKIPFGGMKNDG